jgi:beta-1,4-mannosyl-glycoprotein beta-1,4-N-acetylglucosaminyltransferase
MRKSFVFRPKLLLADLRTSVVRRLGSILPIPRHKIYDCFLFNDEIDILRLRLATLYDHVDYFVICESETTFSGESKQLSYRVNSHLFTEFNDKILHFVIVKPPFEAYVLNPANPAKQTSEFWQRNQIAQAIMHTNKTDLIMVSDLDEIPNPKLLRTIYQLCYFADRTVFLSQSWYLLFLNLKVQKRNDVVFNKKSRIDNPLNAGWLGTFACTARKIKQTYNSNINGIWGMKWGKGLFHEVILENGGWHFSYVGGVRALHSKIKALGFRSLSQEAISGLRNGQFCGCYLAIDEDQSYPDELLRNPKAWDHLMLQGLSLEQLATDLEESLATGGD